MSKNMIERDKHISVGTRPERMDAKDKVTGHALYGTDINLPGLLPVSYTHLTLPTKS